MYRLCRQYGNQRFLRLSCVSEWIICKIVTLDVQVMILLFCFKMPPARKYDTRNLISKLSRHMLIRKDLIEEIRGCCTPDSESFFLHSSLADLRLHAYVLVRHLEQHRDNTVLLRFVYPFKSTSSVFRLILLSRVDWLIVLCTDNKRASFSFSPRITLVSKV